MTEWQGIRRSRLDRGKGYFRGPPPHRHIACGGARPTDDARICDVARLPQPDLQAARRLQRLRGASRTRIEAEASTAEIPDRSEETGGRQWT